MKRRFAIWLFIIPLLLGSFLRGQDLLQSYENGHRGACLAFFALMARNHLRYGFAATGGVPVLNPARVDLEHINYYIHHPPGAILLATLGARLGGTNPAGLRLAFLPLAVGIVILIHRIMRRRGTMAAAAAGALAALAPIGVYYGAFVNFEIPTLFFLLLTLHLYLRFQRRRRKKDLYRSLAAFALAVFCDWIALGLPLCLLLLAPFRKRTSRSSGGPAPVRHALLLGAAGVVVFALVRVQYAIQLGRFGSAPDASPTYYRDVTALAPGFDWGLFADSVIGFARTLFGLPLLALAGLGLLLLLPALVRRRLDDAATAALAFLAIGVANELILARNAQGHDYYLLYLLPAAAMLAAMVFPFRESRGHGGVAGDPAAGAAPAGRSSAGARAGAVVLLALLVSLSFRSVELLSQRRVFDLSRLGEKVAAETAGTSVILLAGRTNAPSLQVAAAADRLAMFVKDREGLDIAAAIGRQLGMAGRDVVFLIEKGRALEADADLMRAVEERAARSESENFVRYDLGVLPP